eukprot:427017_1
MYLQIVLPNIRIVSCTGVTPLEEMMCAACIPFVKIYTAAGGQFKCSGNLINIKQDITSFHKRLPNHPEDVPFVFVSRKRKDQMGHNETKLFKVRPNVIRRLLEGLKRNQVPPYANIEIDYAYINSLEEGIPTGINHIEVIEPIDDDPKDNASNDQSTNEMEVSSSSANRNAPNDQSTNEMEVSLSSANHNAPNNNESANVLNVSLSSLNGSESANVMNASLSSLNGSASDNIMNVSFSSHPSDLDTWDARSQEGCVHAEDEKMFELNNDSANDVVGFDGVANGVEGVANGVEGVADVHAFGDGVELIDEEDPLYNCYMPLPIDDETDKNKILGALGYGTNTNPIPAPALGAPVNEFSTPFLMAAAFPTLFANAGSGDPTCKQRRRAVSIKMAVRHLLYYPDKNDDGTYYYRFASHPCFAFWCHNMLRRHSGLKQTKFVCGADPTVGYMSVDDMEKALGDGSKT